MLKDVVSVDYKGGYKIEVTFEDGATGIVDFSKYLNQGGVVEKFKDIEFVKNFNINKETRVFKKNPGPEFLIFLILLYCLFLDADCYSVHIRF